MQKKNNLKEYQTNLFLLGYHNKLHSVVFILVYLFSKIYDILKQADDNNLTTV